MAILEHGVSRAPKETFYAALALPSLLFGSLAPINLNIRQGERQERHEKESATFLKESGIPLREYNDAGSEDKEGMEDRGIERIFSPAELEKAYREFRKAEEAKAKLKTKEALPKEQDRQGEDSSNISEEKRQVELVYAEDDLKVAQPSHLSGSGQALLSPAILTEEQLGVNDAAVYGVYADGGQGFSADLLRMVSQNEQNEKEDMASSYKEDGDYYIALHVSKDKFKILAARHKILRDYPQDFPNLGVARRRSEGELLYILLYTTRGLTRNSAIKLAIRVRWRYEQYLKVNRFKGPEIYHMPRWSHSRLPVYLSYSKAPLVAFLK